MTIQRLELLCAKGVHPYVPHVHARYCNPRKHRGNGTLRLNSWVEWRLARNNNSEVSSTLLERKVYHVFPHIPVY